MFVTQAAYNRLSRELSSAIIALNTYKEAHTRIMNNWNQLIEIINAKGGEDFLKHGSIGGNNPFTPEDVKKLVMLCHPDKHDGKPMAVELTQKLLKLKETMK